MEGRTPYDNVFVTERKFAGYYRNPKDFNILSGKVSRIQEITEEGEYILIGRVTEIDVRNAAERAKENNKRMPRGNPYYALITVEDDTGSFRLQIQRDTFVKLGKPLVDLEPVGKFFLWKGVMPDLKWRNIHVKQWRAL
jgi:hypothetical protein